MKYNVPLVDVHVWYRRFQTRHSLHLNFRGKKLLADKLLFVIHHLHLCDSVADKVGKCQTALSASAMVLMRMRVHYF